MNLFRSKPPGGRRGRHARRARARVRSGIAAAALAVGLLAVAAPQALAATLPPAPTGLAISAYGVVGSQFSVTLGWVDNASNEGGFVVERATASTGPWQTAATVPAHAGTGSTTAVVQPLAAPLEYYLRVRAYNAAGSSLGPDVVATEPAAPVNFKWLDVGHTTATWSFDDAAINERNTYLYQSGPDGNRIVHSWGPLNGGAHTWTATGLEPNTTYVFQVAAFNNVGAGVSRPYPIKTLGEICPHC